jgi:hypothetical protein
VISPGAGARRSRRGFFYQDLYAVRSVLELIDGTWIEVIPESDEDVVCKADDPPATCFVQVKTVENPTQLWSPARLCEPERAGDPATSILGKLFLGKDLDDSCRFLLVVNERVNPALRPLALGRDEDSAEIRAELASRLGGVEPTGLSLQACLERFRIEECDNTADALESRIHRRLGVLLGARSKELLFSEIEAVIGRLVAFVQEKGRGEHHAITREVAEDLVLSSADEVSLETELRMAAVDETLRAKLEAAGLEEAQIRRYDAMRFQFSRARRSAVGGERSALDEVGRLHRV